MESQDWKSMLGAAFNIDIEADTIEDKDNCVNDLSALEQQGKKMIDIILDKKGRHGKIATIVSNLEIDDNNLKLLSSQLKRVCGVGGSARGGEILIQGDKRQMVLDYLKSQGFKARII